MILGLSERFRAGEMWRVEEFVRDCAALGVGHVRVGVSWHDWEEEGGPEFYLRMLHMLAAGGLDVLPVVSHTPNPDRPAHAKRGEWSRNTPPPDPGEFARFLERLVDAAGDTFEYIELWNEPNNSVEWDEKLDRGWSIFAHMIAVGSARVRMMGKKSVLGGLYPPDYRFLMRMFTLYAMEWIDVIGLHGFPGTWGEVDWPGVVSSIAQVQDTWDHAGEVWITETGYSTCVSSKRVLNEMEQVSRWMDVQRVRGVARAYWHSWQDLASNMVIGETRDERAYHLGLREANGRHKKLWGVWSERKQSSL